MRGWIFGTFSHARRSHRFLVSTVTEYSNHNLLVLVGMSAFLSAVVRAPFTAWVIVMEMTDRRSAIFPLMVASIVSYGTSQWLQKKAN
ncbi:hypothetical protein EBQ90_11885 [bacterium]|nr:hypothetical protein [bacterium]